MYPRIDMVVERVGANEYQATCPYWEDILATGKSPSKALSNAESVAIELLKSYYGTKDNISSRGLCEPKAEKEK